MTMDRLKRDLDIKSSTIKELYSKREFDKIEHLIYQFYIEYDKLNSEKYSEDERKYILARVFLLKGHYTAPNTETKIGYFKESAVIFEEIGNKVEMAETLNSLALEYSSLGLQEDAELTFQKSLDVYEEIGEVEALVATNLMLSDLYMNAGEIHKAKVHAANSLKLSDEPNLNAIGYMAQAELELNSQNLILARKYYNNLYTIADKVDEEASQVLFKCEALFKTLEIDISENKGYAEYERITNEIEFISKQHPNDYTDCLVKLSKAISLRKHDDEDQIKEGKEILASLLRDTNYLEAYNNHKMYAIKLLVEYLLDEFKRTQELSLFNQILTNLRILKDTDSMIIIIKIEFLLFKCHLVLGNSKVARKILENITLLVEETRHQLIIDEFIELIGVLKDFESKGELSKDKPSVIERMDEIKLQEYLNTVRLYNY
ncbi:MAG: hypothetical protein INQ03_22785 [Candidatus Heimdallarchaeota archaeon]|nr:hypothetical protein [Candidatus Heimdallarchaeota archaeon]